MATADTPKISMLSLREGGMKFASDLIEDLGSFCDDFHECKNSPIEDDESDEIIQQVIKKLQFAITNLEGIRYK